MPYRTALNRIVSLCGNAPLARSGTTKAFQEGHSWSRTEPEMSATYGNKVNQNLTVESKAEMHNLTSSEISKTEYHIIERIPTVVDQAKTE